MSQRLALTLRLRFLLATFDFVMCSKLFLIDVIQSFQKSESFRGRRALCVKERGARDSSDQIFNKAEFPSNSQLKASSWRIADQSGRVLHGNIVRAVLGHLKN